MHYTYASLLLAGILAVGVAQPIPAQSTPPIQTNQAAAVADYQTPPNAVTISGQFAVVDGAPVIKGEILTPTHTEGDWYNDIPSQEITTPLTRVVVVRYAPNDSDGPKTTILEATNVMPGATLTFEDTEISAGESWEYAATAYLGDLASTNAWGQGTVSVLAGFRPNMIEDMKGVASSITGPITVTFTASSGVEGECDIPFTPTSVWVTRTYTPSSYDEGDEDIDFRPSEEPVVIWSTNNPTSGQAYTVVDDNDGHPMPKGIYTYYAYTSWEWGTSQTPYSPAELGLFEDKPDSPTNVRATLTDKGALITWEAPTKGQGYPPGFVDPKTLRYDVYRYEGYSETVLVAENIAATEAIDPLDDITELQRMSWRVIAHNDLGSSVYGGVTPAIAVGPAQPMPFVETFSKYNYGYDPDNLWSVDMISSDVQWYVGEMAYGSNPAGDWLTYEPSHIGDKDHGMAYASFSQYSQFGTTAYVTSRLDFSEYSTGQVTFNYFTHPEASGKLAIQLLFFDSREPLTLWEGTTHGNEEAWIEKTVSFAGMDDVDMMQLSLCATQEIAENGWYVPIMVDYIKLEGVDYVSVDTLPIDEATAVEYYNLQGIRVAAPAAGQILIRRSIGADGHVSTVKVRF